MIPRVACAIFVSLPLLTVNTSASDVVDFASSLIGRPYVWGAEGPNAFDCSGLTQYVYQEFGIELPRRAISQSKIGESAGRRLQRGDLLFFSSDTRRSLVTHVGIYEGGGWMIDASKRNGRVRRDNLDDEFWAERYMFARRVTDVAENRDDERDEEVGEPSRPGNGRRETLRVLGRLADVLLRRRSR